MKKYEELLLDAKTYQENKSKRENEQKERIKYLTNKLKELKEFAKQLAREDLKANGVDTTR